MLFSLDFGELWTQSWNMSSIVQYSNQFENIRIINCRIQLRKCTFVAPIYWGWNCGEIFNWRKTNFSVIVELSETHRPSSPRATASSPSWRKWKRRTRLPWWTVNGSAPDPYEQTGLRENLLPRTMVWFHTFCKFTFHKGFDSEQEKGYILLQWAKENQIF